MAGHEADLVAEPEAIGGAGDAPAAVLVGGALVCGGGLVADEGRAGIEGERLEAGVDDRAVFGRVAHHRRLYEEARLEGLGRGAVEVAAIVGVPLGRDAGRVWLSERKLPRCRLFTSRPDECAQG